MGRPPAPLPLPSVWALTFCLLMSLANADVDGSPALSPVPSPFSSFQNQLFPLSPFSLAPSPADTAAGGLPFGPILSKLNSLRTTSKKGLLPIIDYASLESATNKFSEGNILGEGGFSHVYKASFNGEAFAAVKKLDGGGQDFEREFEVRNVKIIRNPALSLSLHFDQMLLFSAYQNEIELLGRIRHPNIVSLLGYCVHGETRMLVYELMQNGSLETQLHGALLLYSSSYQNDTKAQKAYTSLSCLFHISRAIPWISDFGLAVIGRNHGKGGLKVSGTLGYVAPEYLLDASAGKKTSREDGTISVPIDCRLGMIFRFMNVAEISKDLASVAAVAVLCIQQEPSYRPLITDVLHSLIPLVPVELGGMLRVVEPLPGANQKSSAH
ncbi:hypothetical protein B296_00050434 [Ensete ventricosum]|uniref:Protein kinase domain-containing protein n=1 Tax=Ensete ventricosum TaxID=4639 RepID=A0A426Y0C4_ENSVE|nr:hypothetical protein B296_00050434 [Ensete ventricosum]